MIDACLAHQNEEEEDVQDVDRVVVAEDVVVVEVADEVLMFVLVVHLMV
jgi:hypothetical protein